MKTISRIRFNPGTRGIEVEGSEQFVKTYSGKLQAMLSWSRAAEQAADERKATRQVRSGPRSDPKEPAGNHNGRADEEDRPDRQTGGAILYRTEKQGKVRRDVYKPA